MLSGPRRAPPRRRAPAGLARGACRAGARLRAGAAAAPGRAPRRARRGLVVLLPEDADARDAAEAAGWFLGDDTVALFPSRGVHCGSGLEPPPHLVGERARALDVLERGGLVCASAAALAEGVPPPSARPAAAPGRARRRARASTRSPSSSRRRATSGSSASRSAASSRSAAGSSTSSRRPAASRCASSSSATRSSRSARSRRSPSARCARSTRRRSIPRRERRRELVEIDLGPDDDEDARRRGAGRSRAAVRPARPTSSGSPTRCARSGRDEGLTPVVARRARPSSTRCRRASRSRSTRSGPRSRRAGLSEAENELGGLLRQELDVVVAFPHRGEALRQQAAAAARRRRRCSTRATAPAGLVVRRLAGAPRLRLARPRHRAAPGHAGLPQAPAARDGGAGPRARRASPTCAPATTSSTRTTGSRSSSASRRRRSPASPATTCCSRFRGDDRVYVPHEQIGKVSRYIGADSQRADALEARRQGLGQPEDARARAPARDGRRAAAALRAAPDAAGHRLRRRARVGRAARGRVPVPRDRGPARARSRRSRRISRRRARWTGSSAATSASARPRSRCAPRSPSRSPASRC